MSLSDENTSLLRQRSLADQVRELERQNEWLKDDADDFKQMARHLQTKLSAERRQVEKLQAELAEARAELEREKRTNLRPAQPLREPKPGDRIRVIEHYSGTGAHCPRYEGVSIVDQVHDDGTFDVIQRGVLLFIDECDRWEFVD